MFWWEKPHWSYEIKQWTRRCQKSPKTHLPLWIFLVTLSLIRGFTLTCSGPEFDWNSSRKRKGSSLGQLFLFDLTLCGSEENNTMYAMSADPNSKFCLLVAVFSLCNLEEIQTDTMGMAESASVPLGITAKSEVLLKTVDTSELFR